MSKQIYPKCDDSLLELFYTEIKSFEKDLREANDSNEKLEVHEDILNCIFDFFRSIRD